MFNLLKSLEDLVDQLGRGKMSEHDVLECLNNIVNYEDADGWTITTKDGNFSAHFEHTIVVRKDKAEILSSFEEIEKVLSKNR